MISGSEKKKKRNLCMAKVSEQVKQEGSMMPVFPEDVLQYIPI